MRAVLTSWSLTLLAISFSDAAPSVPKSGVTVVGIRDFSNSESVPERHVFGGSFVRLPLILEGKEPRCRLAARIFQVAGELAAPLNSQVSDTEISFENGRFQEASIEVPIPEVRQRTEFLVRIEENSANSPRLVTAMRIFAYPKDVARSLKALARQLEISSRRKIAVFGQDPTIRAFLTAGGVEFVDLGDKLPSSLQAALFYVGSAPSGAFAAWDPQAPAEDRVGVVVFVSDPWLFPGVYDGTAQSVSCRKVTLPILTHLDSDPQCQDTFVEMLSQAAEHLLATTKSTPSQP